MLIQREDAWPVITPPSTYHAAAASSRLLVPYRGRCQTRWAKRPQAAWRYVHLMNEHIRIAALSGMHRWTLPTPHRSASRNRPVSRIVRSLRSQVADQQCTVALLSLLCCWMLWCTCRSYIPVNLRQRSQNLSPNQSSLCDYSCSPEHLQRDQLQ